MDEYGCNIIICLKLRVCDLWSPSAQSAHPEYEFSRVITTGMSAPPMEAVMCNPNAPLDTTPAPRESAARVGSPVTQKPANPATLVNPNPTLMISLPGNFNAEESKLLRRNEIASTIRGVTKIDKL